MATLSKPEFSPVGDAEPERMAAIYYKAARIFHEQGYEATSMSDIAEALQITKAGLYYYIDSKEDLLFRIINYGLDWLDQEVIEPARMLGDPEERLRWIIRHHGQGLLRGSRVIPLLTEEVSSLLPKHRRHILSRKRIYFDFVRDTLNELKARRKLRVVDTTVATFGMLLWLPRWYQQGGRLTAAETMDQMINLYLGGLMASGTRSSNSRPSNLKNLTAQSRSSLAAKPE